MFLNKYFIDSRRIYNKFFATIKHTLQLLKRENIKKLEGIKRKIINKKQLVKYYEVNIIKIKKACFQNGNFQPVKKTKKTYL